MLQRFQIELNKAYLAINSQDFLRYFVMSYTLIQKNGRDMELTYAETYTGIDYRMLLGCNYINKGQFDKSSSQLENTGSIVQHVL